jgi:hypothetical protein
MQRRGQYSAAEKFEKLCAFWRSGDSGLPEASLRDRVGRPLLPKWERWARQRGVLAGRRLVDEALLQGKGEQTSAPELMAFAQRERAAFRSLRAALEQHIRNSGLTEDIRLPGAEEALVGQLCRFYREGIIQELAYTEDRGEIPSLEKLSELGSPAFPAEYVNGKNTALCVFVTLFLGKNDVIRLYKAGVKHVTLVDNDADGMADMRLIYPAHWTYIVSDYRDFLDSAAARGLRYDLVVVDQPIALTQEAAWDHFPSLLALFTDTLMISYTQGMVEALGWDGNDLGKLSTNISSRFSCSVEVLTLSHRYRDNRVGDLYWMVMRQR